MPTIMLKIFFIPIFSILYPALILAEQTNCEVFYSKSIQKPLHLRVHEQLLVERNSYPEYVVTSVLRKEQEETSARFEKVLEGIEIDGPQNPVKFALATISQALSSFGQIAKTLDIQLSKEKKNQKKIEEHSEELKKCISDIHECSTTIAYSLEESKKRLLDAHALLLSLEEKQSEIKTLTSE